MMVKCSRFLVASRGPHLRYGLSVKKDTSTAKAGWVLPWKAGWVLPWKQRKRRAGSFVLCGGSKRQGVGVNALQIESPLFPAQGSASKGRLGPSLEAKNETKAGSS